MSILPLIYKFQTLFTKIYTKLHPLTLTFTLRTSELHVPFSISPIIIQVHNGYQRCFTFYTDTLPLFCQIQPLQIQSLHTKFLLRLFTLWQSLANFSNHHIAISITVSSPQRWYFYKSQFFAACLLTHSLSLTLATTRQRSVSQSAPLNDGISTNQNSLPLVYSLTVSP